MLVKIYPENPNLREIDKVVNIMRDGGLVIYPTDTVYAIGCDALNVRAVEKICQLKGVNPQKSNLFQSERIRQSEQRCFQVDEEKPTGRLYLHLADQQ